MDPFALQKQLRDNASDMNEFYKELKSWGQEMKKKESALTGQEDKTEQRAPPKKKSGAKKVTFVKVDDTTVVKERKIIGATDYSAWDKFDADGECEKMDYDENDESDLTDECDDTLKDKAFLEKEKGNKLVKQKKWDEAIRCYSTAINYYSFDPVFYANRALCFLKQENYSKAVADCNLSLKLDNTYVKSYQRRAAAKEAMNNLQEAKVDLETVLTLEPNNKESQKCLDELLKKISSLQQEPSRPISKFISSRGNKTKITEMKSEIETTPLIYSWPEEEDIIPVRAITKPVHLRSKKPLKKIQIQEISSVADVKCEPIKSRVIEKLEPPKSLPSGDNYSLKTDDLRVFERQQPAKIVPLSDTCLSPKEVKNSTNSNVAKSLILETPKNSVQFYSTWKELRLPDVRYNYLKLIKPQQLPTIFKENLDCGVFSEILKIMAEFFLKHNDPVYDYLFYVSQLPRFSTFCMFFTDDDKKNLWNLFEFAKSSEQPKEVVDVLIKKYEM